MNLAVAGVVLAGIAYFAWPRQQAEERKGSGKKTGKSENNKKNLLASLKEQGLDKVVYREA